MTWVVCGIDGLRVRVGKFSVGLGSEVVLGTGVVLGGNVVFGVGVLSGVEKCTRVWRLEDVCEGVC